MALRKAGIAAPLVLLGERQEAELPWCVEHGLTVCVNEANTVRNLARAALAAGKRAPVHLKINTGMSRYGVRWDEALPLIELICSENSLLLEGIMTHFAQSDEADKTFANLQIFRFEEILRSLTGRGIRVKYQHLCNSGGFLDLPHAHRDMVRVGILIYGIFPSTVCRRIPGIEPVMSVKARIAAIQSLKTGETVGYGELARRIGRPGAAQAVGGAMGRNPVPILIPCHRVIAGDGTIGGYGGSNYADRRASLAIKRRLLAIEGIEPRP